jgi:integrase
MATGKLTTLKVKALTGTGRYGDGGGLWLQVRAAEEARGKAPGKPMRRSWLFRYMLDGTARQMGLGPADVVSLAEARTAALECRKQLVAGIDPIEARVAALAAQRAAARVATFKQVAELYLTAHEGNWRNEKHRWQWRQTLEKHAFSAFGDRPVNTIGTGDVMGVLEPLWQTMPETASRLRGRIESVLDYARARDWRSGENPARWRGHIANMLPKRNKARTVEHHAAVPWAKMGAFWADLAAETGTAAAALRFTILTAARTGEAIGARWSEIDLAAGVWTVPAERMKAGREHRVPLSAAAAAGLQPFAAMRTDTSPDSFVFAGTRNGKPLSNMAMSMLLRRMKRDDLTVHGFRSTFRDWTAESTGYAREVAEAALAHVLADKVEAAYRRGDLFDKRRRLMEDWAAFCSRPEAPAGAQPIRRVA